MNYEDTMMAIREKARRAQGMELYDVWNELMAYSEKHPFRTMFGHRYTDVRSYIQGRLDSL